MKRTAITAFALVIAAVAAPSSADTLRRSFAVSDGGTLTLDDAGVRVSLDAQASGGDVSSDVPVTLIGRQHDNTLAGDVNGGGARLVLRTSGGGIRIRH